MFLLVYWEVHITITKYEVEVKVLFSTANSTPIQSLLTLLQSHYDRATLVIVYHPWKHIQNTFKIGYYWVSPTILTVVQIIWLFSIFSIVVGFTLLAGIGHTLYPSFLVYKKRKYLCKPPLWLFEVLRHSQHFLKKKSGWGLVRGYCPPYVSLMIPFQAVSHKVSWLYCEFCK